jgi:hypothetical protein
LRRRHADYSAPQKDQRRSNCTNPHAARLFTFSAELRDRSVFPSCR